MYNGENQLITVFNEDGKRTNREDKDRDENIKRTLNNKVLLNVVGKIK